MTSKTIMYVSVGVFTLLMVSLAFAAIVNNGSLKPENDTVVVYGQNAAVTDVTGATDVLDSLKAMLGVIINETTVLGEAKPVEISSQPLYLGDYMPLTKTTFTNAQLPNVLADGTVNDENGNDFDYNLKINVPNSRIIYGETDDNLDPPVIFADFDSSSISYDMRIIFPTAVNVTKLVDSYIILFGKKYVFSGDLDDLDKNQVTLFERSKTLTINDQEPVTFEGHTYNIVVLDTDKAKLYIDGDDRNVKEGSSVKINGTSVYVETIYAPNTLPEGKKRFVEISTNANPLVLENGNEVNLNDDTVPGTLVNFVNSGEKVSEIKITITPSQLRDEVKYLKIGAYFTDPIFNTTSFIMQGINPRIDDLSTNNTREYIEVKATREDRAGINFINRLDKEYSLDVLVPYTGPVMLDANYEVTTNSSLAVYNATTQLGVGERKLVVQPNQSIEEEDYFITTSGEYSQIWQVDNIGSDGKIKIRELSGDSSDLTIPVNGTSSLNLADGSSATVKLLDGEKIELTDTGSSQKISNFVYTKNGGKITLPIDNTGKIKFDEETQYNGGTFTSNNGTTLGKTLSFVFAYKERSGRNMYLATTNYGMKGTDYWSGDVGDYDVYSITKYGTFIKQTGNDDKRIQLYYAEDATKAKFYIGEQSSSITTIEPTSDMKSVKDNELSELDTNKNVVIIGGSCINEQAAQFLGFNKPVCGEEFTSATGVGEGQYLIQVKANPKNVNKLVILIAGYEAADTTRAINDILSKPINLAAGSKIIG